MIHKLDQRLLADADASSMNDLDRPLSSRSGTTYSAPFVNSFAASFSDLRLNHVDTDDNKELLHALRPTDDWPLEPASLPANLNRTESWLKILWDYLMIVLSLLLLVKLALVITAWHADRDHKGVEIDQVSQLTLALVKVNAQMVTIFTVIFAAIISTTLQRYALFKAQQGASVAELEQLQGSTSPLTTIKLMWMLKSVTATSVTLGLIWSFYYLGSQANTLEYRFEQSLSFRDFNAIIPRNTDNGSNSVFLSSLHDLPVWQASAVGSNAAAAEFHYSFTVQPGADAYGCPLVPDLSILSAFQSNTPGAHAIYEPDPSGWVDVSKQSQTSNMSAYSNMIGWPFGIVNEVKFAPFSPSVHWLGKLTFSPTYLHIDCFLPTIQPDSAFPPSMFPNQTMSLRMTNGTEDAPSDRNGYRLQSFEFWLRPVPGAAMSLNNTSMTVCDISHKTVDLRVDCQLAGCFAQAIRWANGTNASSATSFHTPLTNGELAQLFFDNFVQHYDTENVNGFKPVVLDSVGQYLQTHPQTGHNNATQGGTAIEAQLHQSLTVYFNTFFTASQMITLNANYDPALFDQATFHGALYQPQYIISWGWISMDLMSCLILLSAAVLSLILRRHTLAPDILSSISSLVRDSSHSGLPNNATGLSGLQRTWLMRKVMVQLGDVSGHGEEIGRIALRRIDPEEVRVKTLNEWTKYH